MTTATRADLEGLPRLLTRDQVAAYCAIHSSTVDAWVKKGWLPPATFRTGRGGTTRWDRRAIDRALDARSGLAGPESAEDELIRRARDGEW